jgi:hypothetical protein
VALDIGRRPSSLALVLRARCCWGYLRRHMPSSPLATHVEPNLRRRTPDGGDELHTNTSICSDIRLGDERLAARTASPFTHSQSWAHTPYIIHGRLHTLERTYTRHDRISLSSTAHTHELNTPPPMATHARDHGDYTRKPTSFSLFRPLSTSPQFIHSERLPTIAALGAPLIMAAALGCQRNHARPGCPRTSRLPTHRPHDSSLQHVPQVQAN